MTAPMHPDTMISLMRQRQRDQLDAAANRRRIRLATSRNTVRGEAMNAFPIAALIARDATARQVRSALPNAPVVDAEPSTPTVGPIRRASARRLHRFADWLARGQIAGPPAGPNYAR